MNDFNTLGTLNTKKCLVCHAKHDVLHWHFDEQNQGAIWCFCQKCQRGYSLYDYVSKAGLSLREFLKNDFSFEESKPNEVSKMQWPHWFIPLFDPRASKGLDYVKGRGLGPSANQLFYDVEEEGIVFPYYFHGTFVGAQVRFIEAWTDKDGEERKIDTIPGTRLGLLFGLFDQSPLPSHVKCIVVCEGVFNALSIQQALNSIYGSSMNPYKCIATSGCNLTDHHSEVLKELKVEGKKIVLAYDFDEAGLRGMQKAIKKECITHVAWTGDSDVDWNDIIRLGGEDELRKAFFKGVKSV